MKFRRARSIFFHLQQKDVYVQNFLQNKAMNISLQELGLIQAMEEWVDENFLMSHFEESSTAEDILNRISKMILCGIILPEGTKEEEEDAEYGRKWEWGPKTGAYHFTLKNTQFFPVHSDKMKSFYKKIEQKTKENPSPALFTVNKGKYDKIYSYTIPSFTEGIFKTIKQRRTVRHFDCVRPVSQEELMICLYAGLGIVKFRDVPPMGQMPMKMTPSGGARNPFDALILCRNVKGLPTGIYQYSAVEHSLGLVNDQIEYDPASLLGDQLWINNAAVVVFLVANFERTMWKYSHPVGYKAIMLEAGHIAQNIILAANEQGFYGSPTAAVISSRFEKVVKEKNIYKSCVYAIVMGYAQENAIELI